VLSQLFEIPQKLVISGLLIELIEEYLDDPICSKFTNRAFGFNLYRLFKKTKRGLNVFEYVFDFVDLCWKKWDVCNETELMSEKVISSQFS